MWQLNWPWIRHKWMAAVLTLSFLPSWFGVISTLWHTILHVKAIAVQLFQECNRILPITVVMVVHHNCLWIYAQLDSAPVATWLYVTLFFKKYFNSQVDFFAPTSESWRSKGKTGQQKVLITNLKFHVSMSYTLFLLILFEF